MMKREIRFVFIALITAISLFSCNRETQLDLSNIDPGSYDSTWYNRAPMRFIQTNLREIDASMDIDVHIKSLVEASANVVLFNVGGIRAFYPTKLPYHYKSPFLKSDLVGDVVKKYHENGIKFVARFDMSKVHESVAAQHPDWLYVGTDGLTVNYNGEVHTCIMGWYQQEGAFRIMEEAISSYPFDGVFFNNAGFTTTDYCLINHGICQCNNCKKGFKETTGLNLPIVADLKNPVFQKYKEWQKGILSNYSKRVKDLFNRLNPGLVFFNPDGQVHRSESGTPFTKWEYWTYHGTENTKNDLGSRIDLMSADTYNYLLGMDYRHIATAPQIGRIFMTQHMLNGAGPGIYFIGHLDNQLDRAAIQDIKDLFGFHKKYEKLFTNLESEAKVALVPGASGDYRGIMRMLSEEHIMYDLIQEKALGKETLPRKLDSYDVLILSNVAEMDEANVTLIDSYVEHGGCVLFTGLFGIAGEKSANEKVKQVQLQCIGVEPECELFPRTESTYLKVKEDDKIGLGKEELKHFDVMMMNSEFLKCKPKKDAKSYLNLVPHTMHGPPEKCYFNDSDVTETPGMFEYGYGKGKTVLIPWMIGSQYEWRGNNAQLALFMAVLKNILKLENQIETNSSHLVEMTHLVNRNEAFEWIGMLNHSGQLGNTFRDPLPVMNTAVRFKPQKPVKSVHLIRSGKSLDFIEQQGWIECTVPRIDDFEMIFCLYK